MSLFLVSLADVDKDAVERFLKQAREQGWKLLAPDCLFYEVVGALRKAMAQYVEIAEQLLKSLIAEFPIELTSCRELAVEALQISCKHALSSYDAFYVALAKRHRAKLLTSDARLKRALASKPELAVEAYSLEDLGLFKAVAG
ncbi:MAG: type II toxin-antitoxin system VapC family toxin [Thermoflexales bacterium]|nr:type II toxin-antitoxin system VapC family toxin [Thermoflexales bacterium]